MEADTKDNSTVVRVSKANYARLKQLAERERRPVSTTLDIVLENVLDKQGIFVPVGVEPLSAD